MPPPARAATLRDGVRLVVGDGDTCHAICEALAGADRLISPTRFHNSVHNAPAGYWSIATRDAARLDQPCAFDASFAAGLLEAAALVAADGERVLLVAYDAPYPEPLRAMRPVPDAFALALRARAAARAAARWRRSSIKAAGARPDTLDAGALESMRRAIPAARALPLLHRIACGGAGTRGDRLPRRAWRLEVAVAPCG